MVPKSTVVEARFFLCFGVFAALGMSIGEELAEGEIEEGLWPSIMHSLERRWGSVGGNG